MKTVSQKKISSAILSFPTLSSAQQKILTVEALSFIRDLHLLFEEERQRLLSLRAVPGTNQTKFNFKNETAIIRNTKWKVSKCPDDLQNRTVEITGPVDRKMIINGLNSGANVYMADFEDSTSPTWANIIDGQVNLYDAVRSDISYFNPSNNKSYALNDQTATLMVRPRGFHLNEKHLKFDKIQVSASLFDFGLYMFHNASQLINNGSGPYFYLPKLEDHEEAELWNLIFVKTQEILGIPQGTIKATVLIETLPAAFQMEEILFALKEHSAGLNCGRWDYIFSYIKNMHASLDAPLPDRSQITMSSHFMKSYCELLVDTCHKRGAFAMGGMAAQIPIKNDDMANEKALEKVRQDKIREVKAGHDGTWVAHPGLINLARESFEKHMIGDNQIDRRPKNQITINADDLLKRPEGTITEKGIILNIDVGVRYIAAWLSGNGCVPIYNLMEDAATAEISRTQLWHWYHSETVLEDGRAFNNEQYEHCKQKALEHIKEDISEEIFFKYNYSKAFQIMDKMVKSESLRDFITLELYEQF